jgi:23S rRNA pseudouridine955/2504/2580 synthase
MSTKEIIITTHDAQQKLQKFLAKKFQNISFVQWQKWFRSGQIRLNKKRVSGSETVIEGDEIRIPPFLTEENTKPVDLNSYSEKDIQLFKDRILFETKDYIVWNKPFGLAVQGGTNTTKHVDGLLKALYPENTPKLVHRLDRDTSGILLLAKNTWAAQRLSEAFQNHTIQKYYRAITEGRPPKIKGIISAYISKSKIDGKELMYISEKGDDSQYSETDYEIITSQNGYAYLELKPKTGRTHQLRVHCSHIGCPILGDPKYNRESSSKKLHLHAYAIEMPKEFGGKRFEAPISGHFEESLQKLFE